MASDYYKSHFPVIKIKISAVKVKQHKGCLMRVRVHVRACVYTVYIPSTKL